MEDTTEKKTLAVDERLRLIDVSSEDDCLIFSLPGSQNEPDYFELSEALNAQEKKDAATSSRENESHPVPSESVEPEGMGKAFKYNLRKSLTWDSAFFTSAGVLDPEELSIINCGLKKPEIHPLPGIQEDVRRSVESTSTLDSDNLSLESLEVDLFADIRASIQRSSKATTLACSTSKIRPEESSVQTLHSSKKMDVASRNKMKSMAVSKRQSISTQGSERTKKEAIIRPRDVQATAKSGEPGTPSLRPPGRANPISAASAKRTSLGANRVKNEPHMAKAATGTVGPNMVSKKAGSGGSSVTPRSTTSFPSSATKIESAASCSSHNRSGSSSSDSTGKSPLKSSRNKTNSRNVNPVLGSTIKTPLKVSSKSKTDSGNSRLMTYLKSVSKPTSSVSPSSSIDGWSSESSSSTSTVNQRSRSSRTSPDSPRKGFYLEKDAAQLSDLQNHPHDHTPTEAPMSFKPSGLRMPSPKIGFFDAEKSVAQTPNSGLQFHPGVRSGIPKHQAAGNGLQVGAAKAKPGKPQPARTLSGTSNNNCDRRSPGVSHSALSTKPTSLAQLRELSKASPKVFPTPRTTEKSPGITSKEQNDTSLKTGNGSCLKARERELSEMDKSSLVSLQNEVENGGQMDFKNGMITESEVLVDMKSITCTHPKEDIPQNFTKDSSGCDYDGINPSKKSCEKPVNGENHVESNLSSLGKIYEKENSVCVENQVDCLTWHMGTVDLNKEGSLSQLAVDNRDNLGDPKLALLESMKATVHEDFPKGLSQRSPLSLNSTDLMPSTRSPLAAKLSSCNGNETFESALEPMVDTMSTFSLSESTQ